MLNLNSSKEVSEPKYIRIVRDGLSVLASGREKGNRWEDSEKEDPTQTLAFKTAEALDCFLIANELFHEEFKERLLKEEIFISDLIGLLAIVERDNFNPNPYAFTRKVFNCTDFAAFLIPFLMGATGYLKKIDKLRETGVDINKTVKKALDFLIDNAHESKEGTSWSGTTENKFKGTILDDVYFTSCAIKTLGYFLVNSRELKESLSKKIKDIIKNVGRWFLNCQKEGTIYSNPFKRKVGINYATYLLDGLFSSWSYQEENVKETFIKIMPGYLKLAKEEAKSIPTVYFDIMLPGKKTPEFYEDRITSATVLATLCLGKEILKGLAILDRTYDRTIRDISNTLIQSRSTDSNLWGGGGFVVGDTYRAINALLHLQKFGRLGEIPPYRRRCCRNN